MTRLAPLMLLIGCSSSPCKTVSMDPLLAGAAAVRVDVYDAGSARCEGPVLAPGAGPPLVSKKFSGGAALQLSLGSGTRVVVVSTFSDENGTLLTGSACSVVTLSGGKAACLSIELTEIDGGVVVSPDGGLPSACQSAADCSTVHGAPVCAGGSCSWTCESGFGHCQNGNTGCETDLNSVENCGGCGNACGTANATANRCVSGQCGYDCQTGFLDCLKLGFNQDGCESDSNALASCGGCGNACDSTHSVGASCSGTVCSYSSCMAGYSDCDTKGANANGCEFMDVDHQVGVSSLTYSLACTPLGTPGNAATYTAMMAQSACATWIASVGGGTCAATTCTGNIDCERATFGGMCVTWCYTKGTAGRVVSAAACTCPNTGSPTWN